MQRCLRCTGLICHFGTHEALFLVQYMHIPIRDQCNWLRERIETSEPACPRGSGCIARGDMLPQKLCHAFLRQHTQDLPQLDVCQCALSSYPLGACPRARRAGRRSHTRRSASCTCWTGWPGARCSSRSWPASTPRPSALAWRRAHDLCLSIHLCLRDLCLSAALLQLPYSIFQTHRYTLCVAPASGHLSLLISAV